MVCSYCSGNVHVVYVSGMSKIVVYSVLYTELYNTSFRVLSAFSDVFTFIRAWHLQQDCEGE